MQKAQIEMEYLDKLENIQRTFQMISEGILIVTCDNKGTGSKVENSQGIGSSEINFEYMNEKLKNDFNFYIESETLDYYDEQQKCNDNMLQPTNNDEEFYSYQNKDEENKIRKQNQNRMDLYKPMIVQLMENCYQIFHNRQIKKSLKLIVQEQFQLIQKGNFKDKKFNVKYIDKDLDNLNNYAIHTVLSNWNNKPALILGFTDIDEQIRKKNEQIYGIQWENLEMGSQTARPPSSTKNISINGNSHDSMYFIHKKSFQAQDSYFQFCCQTINMLANQLGPPQNIPEDYFKQPNQNLIISLDLYCNLEKDFRYENQQVNGFINSPIQQHQKQKKFMPFSYQNISSTIYNAINNTKDTFSSNNIMVVNSNTSDNININCSPIENEDQ